MERGFMLKRISTSLFYQRYIARFITDKMGFILFYFFFFCALITIPTIATLYNAEVVDSQEYRQVEMLTSEMNETITINNGKLIVSNSFSLQTNSYIYSFSAGSLSEKLVFYFGEEKVSVVVYGIIINSKTYSDLGLEDIILSSQNSDTAAAIIVNTIDKLATPKVSSIKTMMVIYNFFVIVVNYLFYSALFYLLGAMFNRIVTGKIRYKIVIYSLTPLFICDLFANMAYPYLTILHYIGVIYALYSLFKALKAIVRIEYKKR